MNYFETLPNATQALISKHAWTKRSVCSSVRCSGTVSWRRPSLQSTAESIPYALKDPAPSVFFDECGASSLNFKVRRFVAPENYGKALHELRVSIFNDLNAAKIDMPYQHLVVHQSD